MKKRVKRHAVQQPLDKPFRFIALTQQQNAIVDAADYDWLNQWNWCAEWHPKKKKFYAARNGGKKMIWMHRFILKLRDGEMGDHKNGVSLDNRRKNLRKCTVAQNGCNRKAQKNNKSGYKGVSPFKKGWRAAIGVNRKQIHIGCFANKEAAAIAYNSAAKTFHGEFARLNHVVPKP